MTNKAKVFAKTFLKNPIETLLNIDRFESIEKVNEFLERSRKISRKQGKNILEIPERMLVEPIPKNPEQELSNRERIDVRKKL